MSEPDADIGRIPATIPPWLAAQRDELLAQRGHAWLLQGPSGLGQYELALSLVQAWLCESPNRAPHEKACGVCESCRLIEAKGHPDLIVLMPETLMIERGWPLDEKSQKDIDDKKRKASREIRVDALRETVAFAQLTSGRGRAKAVLVYPAEQMNHVAANALLKTLEEPGGDVRFALATEAAHELLPTIKSRCQTYALRWPSGEEALAWLGTQAAKEPPAGLQAAIQASGGRPLDALGLIEAGAHKDWAKLPRAMHAGDVSLVAAWSPAALLAALQKLCHDLWLAKLGAEPRFFAASDLPKAPPARALSAWSEELKSLARRIDHTWKSDLLIESLVSQAKSTLHSRS
jgi:DNA polymerase III subunit delta'